jgi:hypothetical protein
MSNYPSNLKSTQLDAMPRSVDDAAATLQTCREWRDGVLAYAIADAVKRGIRADIPERDLDMIAESLDEATYSIREDALRAAQEYWIDISEAYPAWKLEKSSGVQGGL